MRIAIDSRNLQGSIILLVLLALVWWIKPAAASVIGLLFFGHLAFFRDPAPKLAGANAVLSPASGKIVEITTEYEGRYLMRDAVKIGVFLSVFDVHVNRAPSRGKVGYLTYIKGKYLNALNPLSAKVNESNWMGFEEAQRRFLIRQVSGAIARRIHCDVKLGQTVEQGQKLGIICYGSRAEIYLPKDSFNPMVEIGQKVNAGQTVLGEWR